MITGFNTDVEHEGVVYHVQTEDKGLETPVILSLVYVGGAILASKRSPYDDLVVGQFDAAALTERLNRQHKLICAAITAGRIEELKRLNRPGDAAAGARKSSRKATTPKPAPAAETPDAAETSGVPAAGAQPPAEAPTVSTHAAARPEAAAEVEASATSNGDSATQSPVEPAKPELPDWFETTAESHATVLEKIAASEAAEPEQPRRLPPREALVASGVTQTFEEFVEELAEEAAPTAPAEAAATDDDTAPHSGVTEIIPVEVDGELHVGLMEERDYKAGEIVTLRVRVSRGPLEAREGVAEAAVTVKVLGTEFRPLILTSKTDRDGVAVIHAWLPRFSSGRAAILVRAAHDGYTAEMRRAVRHL